MIEKRYGYTHENDTVESLLEPGHGILLLHLVLESNAGLLRLSLCHATTGATHDDEKVHTEDTDIRIIARAQIDVLLDAEAKVARLGEVPSAEFVLLYLEPTLEDFLCFGPADGYVDSDFFVAADTECAHCVACF